MVRSKKRESWCLSHVQEYIKALGKRTGKNKLTSVQLRVEELYLDQVLTRARENQAAAIQKAQEEEEAKKLELESDTEQGAAPPPVKPPPPPRPVKSLNGQADNITHKLRAGDVIEYTDPIFVQGRDEGYRCTTILTIKKQEHPLALQNAEILPKSHRIRRVQRLVRNKLVEYNGHYRAIGDFRLEYDSLEISACAGLKEQAKELGSIVDRNVAKYQPALDALGVPTDFLHNMGGRKRARGGKENETEVAVNENEEGDSKMAATGTKDGCTEPPNKKRVCESPFKDDGSRPVQPKTSHSGESASIKKTEHGN